MSLPLRFPDAKPMGRLLYILDVRATDEEFHPSVRDEGLHRMRIAEFFQFYYDIDVTDACKEQT